MSKFLFDVQEKNRLEQKGVLKRFSIACYGKQPTLESMRAEKTAKFAELAGKKGTEEYEMWFMKYSPGETKQKPGGPHAEGSYRESQRGSKSMVVLDKSLVYSKGAKPVVEHNKTVRKQKRRHVPASAHGKKRSVRKRLGWRKRKTNSFFF
jgi:hypothetical protein